MGRNCSECGDWCRNSQFSSNQWRKGEGVSRCKDCVSGVSQQQFNGGTGFRITTYRCGVCYGDFDTQNELNMHMQVHRPRNFSCPVCGDQRFASGANAVQHVESGYCRGCRGKDNARTQIYQFAQRQRSMQGFLNGTPLLTNGGYNDHVPDKPYKCNQCTKTFRNLSQLMQHQDNKHNNSRLRLGY